MFRNIRATWRFFIMLQILLLISRATAEIQDVSQTTKTDPPQGYVAEWEFQGVSKSEKNGQIPPPRSSPATWLDSNGTWWLFGGQRPAVENKVDTEYFGDLWAYSGDPGEWTPIFRPLHQTPTPLSSYPENLKQLFLCGSIQYGHLAVFGGLDNTGMSSDGGGQDKGSLTPDTDPLLEEDNTVWLYDVPRTLSNTSEDGLWTSYICCDACLPDQNTTLEFCPHFDQVENRRPLVWCSNSALVAVNLQEKHSDWWKFDLEVTEWVKLNPPTEVGQVANLHTLLTPACLSASDGPLTYLACPVSNTKHRNVYIVNTTSNTIQNIGSLTLNEAFRSQRSKESFVLAVAMVQGQALLIIAYDKLLDFWLHDHITGQFQGLENVWKGASLNYFQNTSGFYHLRITFPTNESKTLFLLNPRLKQMNFDPSLSNLFTVNILSDKSVFLPQRDIPPTEIDFSYKDHLIENVLISEDLKSTKSHENALAAKITQPNSTFLETKIIENISATTAFSIFSNTVNVTSTSSHNFSQEQFTTLPPNDTTTTKSATQTTQEIGKNSSNLAKKQQKIIDIALDIKNSPSMRNPRNANSLVLSNTSTASNPSNSSSPTSLRPNNLTKMLGLTVTTNLLSSQAEPNPRISFATLPNWPKNLSESVEEPLKLVEPGFEERQNPRGISSARPSITPSSSILDETKSSAEIERDKTKLPRSNSDEASKLKSNNSETLLPVSKEQRSGELKGQSSKEGSKNVPVLLYAPDQNPISEGARAKDFLIVRGDGGQDVKNMESKKLSIEKKKF